MREFLPNLTVEDWFLVALIGLALLIGYGVHALLREVRSYRRLRGQPVKLKTTEEQRQQWRQTTKSRDLLNLLDDIDTLLRRIDEH